MTDLGGAQAAFARIGSAVGQLLWVATLVVCGAAIAGPARAAAGGVAGGVVAVVAWLAARALRAVPGGPLLGALVGGFVGGVASLLLLDLVGRISWPLAGGDAGPAPPLFRLLLVAVPLYLGLVVGARRGRTLHLDALPLVAPGNTLLACPKILDTSVIIDGRIAAVALAGFIEGPLVVPQFVLFELQQIADSADAQRRTRGRRGLDILRALQADPTVDVTISPVDFADVREVDQKLIELARELDGKIVTNDFNLNKVAGLSGVAVLNINELANAMKPVVQVGERLTVQVQKEGKEVQQGVAYLDDGTMVVVEGGRRAIGRKADVLVTTLHQTTAGKMIFGRLDEVGTAPAVESREVTVPLSEARLERSARSTGRDPRRRWARPSRKTSV